MENTNENMVVVMTKNGDYNTTTPIENILEQWTEDFIEIEGLTKEISIKEGVIEECNELILIDNRGSDILGFKIYNLTGEKKVSKPMTLEEDIQALKDEISEKQERIQSLERALQDQDFQKYLEHKKQAKKYEKIYQEKETQSK